MSHGLHRQPPGFPEILTRGPRPWSERRHGVDRPKPARGVTGGEGGGVWEVHRTRVHLSMPSIEVGVGCSGSATRAGGRRRRELDGEVASTGSGRGGGVGELRGAKAELLVWSARAVELRSYGFHCGQAAAELGQRWREGSGGKLVDGKWSTSCTRARRI